MGNLEPRLTGHVQSPLILCDARRGRPEQDLLHKRNCRVNSEEEGEEEDVLASGQQS